MSGLAGQVAIVTGAGRGIGRAVARTLAGAGAAVLLAARTRHELADAAHEIGAAGGQALAVPTDVSEDAAVSALVETAVGRFDRVDVLVNAAGAATFGPAIEGNIADWDRMLAVNLRGTMLASRAVLPVMRRRGRGTIVTVGSIAGVRAIPGCAAYAATKAAVLAFSRVLAEEVRPAIRVGVVLPGAVDTPLWDGMPGAPDRARMLEPDAVAQTVLFMASLPAGAALEEVRLLPAGGIL